MVLRKWVFPGMFLLVLLCSISFISSGKAQERNPIIRVAILTNVDSVTVMARGRFKVVDVETGRVLKEAKRLTRTKIEKTRNGIQFGPQDAWNLKKLRIVSHKDDIVVELLKGTRQYRGEIDIVVNKDRKFDVINRVDMESYIKGILFHEISHRWPMEAMKAQAVVARTYALFRMKASKNRLYDVTSDIYSQVYGGKSAERYRTNLAVERTRSEILMYNKKIVPAYYHSNCGGHTEDVNEVWKEGDWPPLKGVPCPFCRKAPNYFWKKNIRLKDIQDHLKRKGYALDNTISEISVLDVNKSGRVKNVAIKPRQGKSIVLPAKEFRLIVGPNVIKSSNYYIEMKGYYCDFIGKGWGHGVGMCQWGALFMSQQRYSYEKILSHYYPGAGIVRYEFNL